MIGEILYAVLLGLVAIWAAEMLGVWKALAKPPATITYGTWRDCRHRYGLLEHFTSPWALFPLCCAVNGPVRCQLTGGHKGQHFGHYPEDTTREL